MPPAILRPSHDPAVSAASVFGWSADSSIGGTRPAVSGCPVSGRISFETMAAAGIDRIDAEIRWPAMKGNASRRNSTYMASVVAATVDIPHVITVSNSDRVIPSMYGRTVIADSTPTKTFEPPASDSAPDRPRVLLKRRAKSFTSGWITRR
jgi:hypothetical protein